MTPAKDKFKPGEAYVAFNRVRTIEKLKHNQLHTKSNPCVRTCRKRDERFRKNILPQMLSNLFHNVPGGVKLLHINIGNFKTKIADIKNDDIFQNADIIALNETHLQHSDTLTPHMIGLSQDKIHSSM